MVLVHWCLWLLVIATIYCVPASTLASTTSRWDHTPLRVLVQVQVVQAAWTLKWLHIFDSLEEPGVADEMLTCE